MTNKLKLHLGNGTVYLGDEWTNIDMVGPLAKDCPEIAKRNLTTIDNYYKFPFRQNKDNNVTDIIMDVRNLDFLENSVDEILCVNLIDHMKKEEFLEALKNWKKILKVGGTLIIDVDDRQEHAKTLVQAKTNEEIEQAFKLFYCDHSKKGMAHFWGYTGNYLKQILINEGFEFVWIKNNYIIHDRYPNFQIMVQKI